MPKATANRSLGVLRCGVAAASEGVFKMSRIDMPWTLSAGRGVSGNGAGRAATSLGPGKSSTSCSPAPEPSSTSCSCFKVSIACVIGMGFESASAGSVVSSGVVTSVRAASPPEDSDVEVPSNSSSELKLRSVRSGAGTISYCVVRCFLDGVTGGVAKDSVSRLRLRALPGPSGQLESAVDARSPSRRSRLIFVLRTFGRTSGVTEGVLDLDSPLPNLRRPRVL